MIRANFTFSIQSGKTNRQFFTHVCQRVAEKVFVIFPTLISHGIVENHGGRLWFESVEGAYTKAVIDLPVNGG